MKCKTCLLALSLVARLRGRKRRGAGDRNEPPMQRSSKNPSGGAISCFLPFAHVHLNPLTPSLWVAVHSSSTRSLVVPGAEWECPSIFFPPPSRLRGVSLGQWQRACAAEIGHFSKEGRTALL